MTSRSSKLYIKDILESIERIESYTKSLTFDEFSRKKMAVDAVIRNFEVIGEASRHIPSSTKALYKEVPWKEMAGMRNKVIHEYFGVDLDIVWKTIKQSVPHLKNSLRKIKTKV